MALQEFLPVWVVAGLAAAIAPACAVDAGSNDWSPSEEQEIQSQSEELTVSDDFRIAVQLANNCTDLPGDWQQSGSMESGGATSPWACDGKGSCFDPDAARIKLDVFNEDNVKGKDFRICMQAADGQFNHSPVGTKRCTPWASQDGGTTGLVTDNNAFDPDSYRVSVETRSWPSNTEDQEIKFRLRLRAWDNGNAFTYTDWTTWSDQGGGTTDWATSSSCFDVDGFEIEMDVADDSVFGYCSTANRCQHGFGDCTTNADCVSGTTCVNNVGNAYGYIDNSVDVCVD